MKKLLTALAFLLTLGAKSQINSCVYPYEKAYGSQVRQSLFYGLDGVGVYGSATPIINGTSIDLTGGSTGVYTSYITFGDVDMMPHFHKTVRFKITAWSATSAIGVGRASINPVSPSNTFDIGCVLLLGTTGTTPVYISGLRDGQVLTTGPNFTFTLNDSIQVDLDLNVNVCTATAQNLTTHGAAVVATKTWATPTVGGAGGYWPNSGRFAVWNMGGTQEIYYADASTTETRFPSTVSVFDSKARFGTTSAVLWGAGAIDSLNLKFKTVVNICDEGSSTAQQIAGAPQALAFGARQYFLEVSTNDLRGGMSMANFVHSLDTVFALYNSPTHPAYFIIIPEDSTKSGVGLAEAYNYLVAKYPNNCMFNVWTVMGGGTNILVSTYTDGAGIHLSQAGHSALYRAILAWGKMPITYCMNRSSIFQNIGPGLKLVGDSLVLDTAYLRTLRPVTQGGTFVTAITDPSSTLNISAPSGAITIGLNLNHANTITANWIFPNIGVGGGAATYHLSDGTFQGTTANTNLGGYLFTQAIAADNTIISFNSQFNGSNQKYVVSGFAYAIQANGGDFNFYNAVSGTGGNNITYLRPLTIKNSGAIGTGGITSPLAWVHVPASTTSFASLDLPIGVAPTSLTDGMIWNDNNIKFRTGGVTYQVSNPTITYAQLATTNTVAIGAGTAGTFVAVTSSLAGLADTAMKKLCDSIHNGLGRFATLTGAVNISNADLTMASGGHSLTISAANPFKIAGQPSLVAAITTQALVKATDSSVQQMPLAYGTYTPTLTNTANITSSSLGQNSTWTRVGNVVHVSIGGSLLITALATNSTLTVTLPIATSATTQLGVGDGTVNPNNSGFTIISGQVTIVSSTTARFDFFGAGIVATGSNFSINFDYVL